MKLPIQIKKVHLIITALLFLNVAAFLTVSTLSKQTQEEVSTAKTLSEAESYFQSGVKVLNWGYSMLRYFRHQDNT